MEEWNVWRIKCDARRMEGSYRIWQSLALNITRFVIQIREFPSFFQFISILINSTRLNSTHIRFDQTTSAQSFSHSPHQVKLKKLSEKPSFSEMAMKRTIPVRHTRKVGRFTVTKTPISDSKWCQEWMSLHFLPEQPMASIHQLFLQWTDSIILGSVNFRFLYAPHDVVSFGWETDQKPIAYQIGVSIFESGRLSSSSSQLWLQSLSSTPKKRSPFRLSNWWTNAVYFKTIQLSQVLLNGFNLLFLSPFSESLSPP
jgi:hypothetical protein